MHHRARLLLLILVASVEANLFSRWAPYLPPPSHGHSHHRSLRAPRGLVSEPDDVHPICKRSVTATQAGTNRSNWIFPPRLESSPLKLATPPHCGSLEGKSVVDSNMGIDISKIKTIVAFGDSYSSTGWDDGRDPTEAIVRPPSPFSGTQDPFYGGRFSNGWVWTEWLAKILPSKPKLRDFAVSGAVTNISYFPGPSRSLSSSPFFSDSRHDRADRLVRSAGERFSQAARHLPKAVHRGPGLDTLHCLLWHQVSFLPRLCSAFWCHVKIDLGL